MIAHTANIIHATLHMSSLHGCTYRWLLSCYRSTCLQHVFLLEFAREVRRQNGRKITVGTQTLDKCKDFIPTSVHTKNAKNKLLNAEIWSYVYQWQWRCNHRHALWQMVPKVPKGLCAWDVAPANEKGKKDRVRYGRRYSVFLWRPAFPTPSSWQGVSSGDGIWEIRTCFHISVETFLTSRAHFGKRRKAPRTNGFAGVHGGHRKCVFYYLGLEMPRASLICFETVKNITWI